MAGVISMELQLVLYGLLVVIIGFAGYYVGKMYAYPMVGAGVGVIAGLIISGVMYKYMGGDESSMTASKYAY